MRTLYRDDLKGCCKRLQFYTVQNLKAIRGGPSNRRHIFCVACVAERSSTHTSIVPEFHACTQMEDTILVRCKRGTDAKVIINFVEDRGLNLHGSSTTTHTRASREETMLGTDAQGATIEGNAITHSSQTQGCELWGMVDQGRMIKIGDVATLLEIDCDEASTKSR